MNRAALRDESGVALVVAMGVMMIVMLLGAVMLASAVQLSASSLKDTNQKRALEAADAGLQVATYRLNMLAPSPTMCVTTIATLPLANGACAAVTQPMGNGASYTYVTTPVLGLTGTCAGLPLDNSTVIQRCVTSTGTVNNVVRRVQTRIAAYAAQPVFPLSGLVGLHSLSLANNAVINGSEGSNGQITVNNNATATATVLGPSAPNPAVGNNGSAGTVTRRSQTQGPFVLTPVNPGNSATVSDDTRIVNALAHPAVNPADAVSGGVTFNAATRTLTLGNNASITLGGALYNFCNLVMANNTTLTIAAGARTAIYIDSPDRPGSGCLPGSGQLSVSNNSSLINNSPPAQGSNLLHDTTALQLYVYGLNDGSNVVTLRNNTSFYGTLYAPQSTINIINNGSTNGSVAGNNVAFLNNATFNGDPNDQTITTGAAGVFFRTAWHECLDHPSNASDPQSGC